MKVSILTIMPELFGSFLEGPVISRAVRKGALSVEIIDIRDYAPGSFRHIDDSPFGGGAGMVMRCQPVLDALRACRTRTEREKAREPEQGNRPADARDDVRNPLPDQIRFRGTENRQDPAGTDNCQFHSHTVLLSPAGTPYTQEKAHALSKEDHLILLCGHYEGVDARVIPHVDEQISIGDYVLTGGELAAQVILDSIARLLPGSLRPESTREESFENGLLEYPQYTQPAVYEGSAVPEVLRSGDHERIRKWRLQQSLLLTREMRPDLFARHVLTEEEKELLREDS